MITGSHAIVYAEDAEATRAFLRDVIGLPSVDAGDGWLIFRLPPAEVGVHPAAADASGRHELFLLCDDIEATIEELAGKGVEVSGPPQERRFGRMTSVRIPGAGEMGLYQPSHPVAYDLGDDS